MPGAAEEGGEGAEPQRHAGDGAVVGDRQQHVGGGIGAEQLRSSWGRSHTTSSVISS